MAGASFKAVSANGFVHLTVHNPDHPDHTIRMLATELPNLLEALAAVKEVPAAAHPADAAPANDHAHEDEPHHEDVKPAAAAEDPPAGDHPKAS